MKVKFKKLILENYKCFDNQEVEFSDVTKICGMNATGKTTIMAAVYDILTDKSLEGGRLDDIRPQKDGEDANDDPIIRTLIMEVDGTEYCIKKMTIKKFSKNRATGETTFRGNEVSYDVDGYEMKSTEYMDFIEKLIPSEALAYGVNPVMFINMMRKNTIDARNWFTKNSGYDASKYLEEHQEFAEVSKLLKMHSIEDVKKNIKKKTNTLQKEIEALNKQLEMLKKGYTPIDTKAIEEEISTLEGKLSEVDEKMLKAKESNSSIDITIKHIEELKNKLNDMHYEFNKSSSSALVSVQKEIMDIRSDINKLTNKMREAESMLGVEKSRNSRYAENHAYLQDKHRKAKAEEFDDKATVCRICGQKLPDKDIKKLIKEFEARKKANVEQIAAEGNDNYAKFKASADKIKGYEENLKAYKESIDKLEEMLAKKLVEEKASVVTTKFEDTDEYKKLTADIEELKKKLETLRNNKVDERAIWSERNDIITSINECKLKVKYAGVEAKQHEDNILSVTENIKNTTKEYASNMAVLDGITEFSIGSNKAMSDFINQYFDYIRFEMADYNTDGTVFETCRIVVDGIDYLHGLNHGSRMLADVDLVKGIQKMFCIEMPIFIDDTESLDDDKIPSISNQMVLLRRTDNPLEVRN